MANYRDYYQQYIQEAKIRKDDFPNWLRFFPTHHNNHNYLDGYKIGVGGIQYYTEYAGGYGEEYKGFVVGIYLDDKSKYKKRLTYLEKNKNLIEKQFDTSLIWLDTDKAGRIFLILRNNIEDKTIWAESIKWQIDNVIKFMNIFQPYMDNINNNKFALENVPKKIDISKEKTMPLNQILYGPPGTGKTYNTINKALEIIDNKVLESRDEAKRRFEDLQKAGQIEFVTFHQSYGYEEFVEGIKASATDGHISYDVENGVFKKLCKEAKKNLYETDDFKENIEKYRKLLEKEEIILHTITGTPIHVKRSQYGITTATEHSFSIDKLIEINNGILTSNPDKTYGKFIVEDINKRFSNISDINNNHIIIIDEINRGNISKIFGELITLIEPSKRIGSDDEIKLRLPYSNDEFGVPQNLYIIGTMNTADRSIALMDTALRRRFEFVEMMPDIELLDFYVDDVHIKSLLSKVNERVEYLYDRDHTIGHAYFLSLHVDSSLDDLTSIFKNKIIPLLQEYFYDDWEKILLVLNDGFISKNKQDYRAIFDEKMDDDYVEDEKYSYDVKEEFLKESYIKIYEY